MEYWYIPLADETKRPVAKFGGWPIDPDHSNVFQKEEITDAEHDNWAIVGSSTRKLLVIDVDYYKMTDEERQNVDSGWMGLLEHTRIVKTQSGGLHVYFLYDGEELPRSIENVDIKGEVGKGYVVSPLSPGYELQNDKEPLPISRELLTELPVFQNEQPRPVEGSVPDTTSLLPSIKRGVPPCWNRATRAMGTHDDPEDFAASFVHDYHRKRGDDEDIIQQVFKTYFNNFDGNIPSTLDTDRIDIHDVIQRSQFPEGKRVEHPSFLHSSPSDSKSNFMVDEGAETFRCWRHDVTGNALHLLGVKGGIIDCGDWVHGSVGKEEWLDIFEYAKEQGYDPDANAVTCEDIQDHGFCPYDCGRPFPFS